MDFPPIASLGGMDCTFAMLEKLAMLFVVISAGIFIAHAIDSYRSRLQRAF